MQNRLIDFTAERKVLELQNEELRSKQFNSDQGQSITTRDINTTMGSGYDQRKEIENEHLKRKLMDAEAQIRDLKDELHRTKVEKEKILDKYEHLLDENQMTKDQNLNIKKLAFEMEKKDFIKASNAKNTESPNSMFVLGNTSTEMGSQRGQGERPGIDKTRGTSNHLGYNTDDRPIRPAANHPAHHIEDRIKKINAEYIETRKDLKSVPRESGGGSGSPRGSNVYAGEFAAGTAKLNTFHGPFGKPAGAPARPLDSNSNASGILDRGSQGTIKRETSVQQLSQSKQRNNILTWDNPYNGRNILNQEKHDLVEARSKRKDEKVEKAEKQKAAATNQLVDFESNEAKSKRLAKDEFPSS